MITPDDILGMFIIALLSIFGFVQLTQWVLR